MHANAFQFVESAVATLSLPDGLVVEIGGRNINGTIRGLFRDRPYISVDIADGPGVDVVANGANYRPPSAVAVVVCCEVLEHTKAAPAICRNAHRILQPGGVFIVTAATKGRAEHSAVDGGPKRPDEFYRNVSADELCDWLDRFGNYHVEVNEETHDVYGFAIKRPKAKGKKR